jgi:hypothetical protein
VCVRALFFPASYFNCELFYEEESVIALIRGLSAVPKAARIEFFESAVRSRRRDRMDWRGTDIEAVFVHTDERKLVRCPLPLSHPLPTHPGKQPLSRARARIRTCTHKHTRTRALAHSRTRARTLALPLWPAPPVFLGAHNHAPCPRACSPTPPPLPLRRCPFPPRALQMRLQDMASRVRAAVRSRYGSLLEAFSAFDADGDSWLSYRELQSAIHGLDLGIPADDAVELILQADKNADGFLDYRQVVVVWVV